MTAGVPVDWSAVAGLSGAEARALIRGGRWRQKTVGMAQGWVQANLVVLPAAYADDFQRFCERNSQACPVLDVTAPGSAEPRRVAPGADLRTDAPHYRVYRGGALAGEADTLHDYWRDDLVAFVLGCSFTFEAALARAGIPLRHMELGLTAPMYVTDRPCVPAGLFQGPLVVTMRPVPEALVERARAVTARFPRAHGAPVHVGDPAALGIADLARPEWGDAVPVPPGDVPVYWACGVTPQAAAEAARIDLMLTHAPAHMFITDLRVEDLEDG
ncbi:MAG TPA: putative hydro-lyase [Chloroflexota bacterium]